MLHRELTKKELAFVSKEVDKVIASYDYEADFTGTTVSPYNIQSFLRSQGFLDDVFDTNSSDYWRSFTKDDLTLEIFFNAESFELKLYRPEC